ncbi:CD48 antigen-like isoform X2 [Mugil cephalus]|uniref:CD48 antigen-like isoform X2 n=1 Tax=Mugil cephalus TaxID=48193 RepID=UPI001FB77AED|nr:CD48 antigen-like isoform X2 [Mugil cephalus]
MSPVMEPRRTIIFLFLVIRLSETEEVKKNLTGTVGGNITIPDPVVERGFLSYGGKPIASVRERKYEIEDEIYMNRLHWDQTTGLFTLTRLKKNDSGVYYVNSKKGRVLSTSYKLSVFDPVPSPAVEKLNLSSESCSLLCSVAEETTLSWYKDEEIMNQSSSAVSLLLSVHEQDFSSSFRCVASNPAEKKTLPVDVTMFCGGKKSQGSDNPDQRHHWADMKTYVQYTDVNVCRRSQGENFSGSSWTSCCYLTTVYYMNPSLLQEPLMSN